MPTAGSRRQPRADVAQVSGAMRGAGGWRLPARRRAARCSSAGTRVRAPTSSAAARHARLGRRRAARRRPCRRTVTARRSKHQRPARAPRAAACIAGRHSAPAPAASSRPAKHQHRAVPRRSTRARDSVTRLRAGGVNAPQPGVEALAQLGQVVVPERHRPSRTAAFRLAGVVGESASCLGRQSVIRALRQTAFAERAEQPRLDRRACRRNTGTAAPAAGSGCPSAIAQLCTSIQAGGPLDAEIAVLRPVRRDDPRRSARWSSARRRSPGCAPPRRRSATTRYTA